METIVGLEPEHRAFSETIRRAARDRIAPHAIEMDKNDRLHPSILPMLHELGVLTLCHPDWAGGPGLDPVSCCIATENLAMVSPAVAVMCVANWATINVLAARPSAVVRDQLARWVAAPTLGSYCLTEPRGGSDASHLATTADRDGDRYAINGTKCYITNAGLSSVYVIIAATDRRAGSRGTTAFVTDAATPGLQVTRLEDKMGTRGCTLAEVRFTDLAVRADQRVGDEGEGLSLAMESQNVSRVALAAACVGMAQGALDHAHGYAHQRVQFGSPIAEFQGIQFKLADMATQVEAARSLVYRAAQCIRNEGQGTRNSRRLAAMAKLFASDVAMNVTVEAVQVFGGAGYIKGNPCEMLMRDAKVFQVFAGTNEIQRRTIFKSWPR